MAFLKLCYKFVRKFVFFYDGLAMKNENGLLIKGRRNLMIPEQVMENK